MPPAPGTGGSRSSTKSTRSTYRVVSKTSDVDETLFGSSKPGSKNVPAKNVKVEKIQKVPSFLPRIGADESTVTITMADLNRMQQPSSILSPEEVRVVKKTRAMQVEAERKSANERKAMMITKEEERKKLVPPTELEKLKAEADGQTLSRAALMLEEEMDDVKRMNQMVLYSKCVTIRDAQIEEKKNIIAEQMEEESRLDLMMEVERIKALEAYEQREQRRAHERKAGAAVLMKQIEDREAERQRQEELKEQEAQQMMREIERMKEEEIQAMVEKKEMGRRLLTEVADSNREQIERKKRMIEQEKAEDERIANYLQERDAKEQAELEEKERVAAEKEREVARLRAQQEKAADKQAELDELRARRAQETYEREWREKERAERERLAAINRDLTEAREQQRMVRVKQLADVARQEESEFRRIIDAQRQKEMEEQQLAARKAAVSQRHKEDILGQIRNNEERSQSLRKEYLEEGAAMRRQFDAERARLEAIKTRKLTELEGQGVPPKYRAELERKKVGESG